jgi:hypothetical protein
MRGMAHARLLVNDLAYGVDQVLPAKRLSQESEGPQLFRGRLRIRVRAGGNHKEGNFGSFLRQLQQKVQASSPRHSVITNDQIEFPLVNGVKSPRTQSLRLGER